MGKLELNKKKKKDALFNTAFELFTTAGVSLSEEEENRIIKIVKQIKDSDIDEEQLRSAVTKAYDKLEEMGIGKEEVKGILHKLADFAKSLFE